MKTGVLIGVDPIKIILVAGIIGFIIIVTAFKSIKGKISKKDIFCNLKIGINKKYTYIKAIIDTGNFLKEPITGVPVIIVEKESLYEVISKEILDNLKEIINGSNAEIEEYVSRIRVIPFSSLGKENGILLGIKVDSLIIDFEDKNRHIENIIVGIYDGKLSKNGKYEALIGLEILEYKGGKSNEFITVIKR